MMDLIQSTKMHSGQVEIPKGRPSKVKPKLQPSDPASLPDIREGLKKLLLFLWNFPGSHPVPILWKISYVFLTFLIRDILKVNLDLVSLGEG